MNHNSITMRDSKKSKIHFGKKKCLAFHFKMSGWVAATQTAWISGHVWILVAQFAFPSLTWPQIIRIIANIDHQKCQTLQANAFGRAHSNWNIHVCSDIVKMHVACLHLWHLTHQLGRVYIIYTWIATHAIPTKEELRVFK